MRRVILFPCVSDTLAGTLDEAPGATGLLIVSGGNEIRVGAHRGMAELAQALAAAGHPVFRYDRRGIGDSTGDNRGFAHSAEDIAAALATFRAEAPQLTRILAFGNCDAATALGLFAGNDVHGLILSNPWVVEEQDELPPTAAIRARYLQRLRDPAAWLRLLRGGIDLRKLFKGVRKLSARTAPLSRDALAPRLAAALAVDAPPVTLLLAKNDNSAMAFRTAYAGTEFDGLRARATLHECDTASHSYAGIADKVWLQERLIAALS